jgi:hypothetical protein
LPAPTIAPVVPLPDPPSATITFADATQIKPQAGNSGRFQLIGLHPREVIDIAVEFPATLQITSMTAHPLDGGKILGPPKGPGTDAPAGRVRFQVGNQPGLYRVVITRSGSRSLLQFWVANPKAPKGNPAVLNPSH